MVDYQFVTERLAVGGYIGTAENMRVLAQAGITHVVNMQKEFDDSLLTDGSGIEVLWNGCEDDFLPKPTDLFWKGVRFTLEALADPDAKVLFHCAAGIHRSPIMLLAVLRVLGYERRQAIDMIADARPQANFPPIYLMSVEDFFREYRASMQTTSMQSN
ncbi:MAG: dual specificity protein phosphatase family protein [Acidobacteria bacterium]|nr:dual specificity protein phosphatase family protein [Acidobacteriota bacterium]